MSTSALPRPIDPFAGSRRGRYEDDAVVVVRRDRLAGRPGRPGEHSTSSTRHFALGREHPGERGRLVLLHALPPDGVDNDVAGLLSSELFAPGWVSGADTFERLLTGVVLSCHDDALTAWLAFYRATLTRIAQLATSGPQPDGAALSEGSVAWYAPVYQRAGTLVRDADTRTLLDLGTCFGFFPLLMSTPRASAGPAPVVHAGDVSPGSCDLLRRVSARLGTPVPALVCDAACVPLPDAAVDTVTLLHVLEHVDAGHGARMLREAVRLARRRVVVAVPLEHEPDAAFGHVRTVSTADLARWGRQLSSAGGWHARVGEFHGGWLVLDHPNPR